MKITRLSEGKLLELEELVMLNITFIDERLIPQDLLVATELELKNIDPNDTVFVALTKQLEGKLWTGDMQLYKGIKAKGFKDILLTSELSLLLYELDRD